MKLIPITESLPEENQDVIVWNGKRLVAAKYVKQYYVVSKEPYVSEKRGAFQVEKYPTSMDRCITTNWSEVTHWMPANIEDPNGNI